MKQKLFSFFLAVLGMIVGTSIANAVTFVDIKADFTDGAFLTSTETSNVTAGLKMNNDGTFTRVNADDADANAVITGKYHSDQHGLQNFSAVVPVEGTVKITFGTCAWGGDVTVKNANNETVATFNTNTGACYHNDKTNNVVSGYYKVNASTTLTISGGSYVPYFAVEAVDPSTLKEEATVSFALGEATGVAPSSVKDETGKAITLPNNFTMYIEGKTLTAWSDGTNEYALGTSYTIPASDITLQPVFTQNTVSLDDRTEPVTLRWNFRRDQGAPTVQWQNVNGNIWVTQATIGNETIDVPMTVNTNPGKFNNASNTNWAQVNNGTEFVIPSCKDATISMEAYSSISTTTIDGQTDYTGRGTTSISYTIANSASTIDIVIGDGEYYRYIQTVLPVVQSSGGTTFNNTAGSVTWAVGNEVTGTVAADVLDAVSTTSSSIGSGLTVTTKSNYAANSGVTMACFQPGTSNAGNVAGVMIEYSIKPKSGVKFKPTNISFDAIKDGTDGAYFSYSYTIDGTESTVTDIPAADILRNDNTNSTEANLNHSIDITEDECDEFALRFYISHTSNEKKIAFSNIVISGVFNGTVADVATYTLTTAVSNDAAGSVSVYPVSDEYEEGTTVKLTATENFGYDFVNWTDGDNNILSTDPVFNHTMNDDVTITANFEAVQTYELNLTVDGTNDYMVTINPAPTVVNNKNMYEAGTTVTLTANQYDGLVTFNGWSDNDTNSEKVITMDADKTITANYAQVDIIAGWDFYKADNQNRPADFASADNEAAVLTLVQTGTTTTKGWLDKSAEEGGYEGFAGAAVNWQAGAGNGDVGNYHWQTKVNVEAFQNINVQFQMLYNYNAYQTYNAEYSLDGTNWKNFGSITMSGAKNAASFSETLPAECNNQSLIYIRMLADKTSTVDGTASANDGNTLAMFFITGDEQAAASGDAPVLVSIVPADNATGASATGKIVLTFDKKVQLANENVKGDLNGTKLTPVVTSKTVTFNYSNLDYNTEYTFTLPANSIGDQSGIAFGEAITTSFTTMERPVVTKNMYDEVVSNVNELLAAINNANGRLDQSTRYRIFIKNGTYTIPLYNTMKTCNGYEVPECITFITGNNISFIGESRDGVVITNAIPADATFEGTYGTTSKYDGIGNSDVFQISSNGIYWQDLTVSTGMEDSRGRDIAIQDKGTKNIYKNVKLHGYQDTWTSNKGTGLYYFEGGIVRGRTDYLCGKGDAYFNGVELLQVGTDGYAIVPSNPASIGWVFKDCVLKPETNNVTCTLGRPWGYGTPAAYLIDTKMLVVPSPIGWSEMSAGWPYRFAEYNSTTSSGATIDLSERKTVFAETHSNNPILTAAEAAELADMSKMFGSWQPTLATEQAPVPQNVSISGNTMTWDESNYALLWAVVKDGNVIDFTTSNSYELLEDGQYSVRAANEMGGLSETSETVSYDAPLVLTTTENMAGYKSFYSADKSYVADDNTKVYRAKEVKGDKVVLYTIDNNEIPAGTPVILKTIGIAEKPTTAVYYQMTLTYDSSIQPADAINQLKVTEGGENFPDGVYRIGWKDDEGVGFFTWTTENAEAGVVYLNKVNDAGAKLTLVFLDEEEEEATGVSTVSEDGAAEAAEAYNVAGQRVNAAANGIIIVKGKKYVK
jgi:uncharacterized repeat protein (TIGR02543 family)